MSVLTPILTNNSLSPWEDLAIKNNAFQDLKSKNLFLLDHLNKESFPEEDYLNSMNRLLKSSEEDLKTVSSKLNLNLNQTDNLTHRSNIMKRN